MKREVLATASEETALNLGDKMRFGSGAVRGRRGFTMIEIMIVMAVIAVIALIAIPNLLASKTATNEAATCGCLKAFLTAEFQFYKKKDYFAPNGLELGRLNLITPDAAAAFVDHNGNGDPGTAPKAGYYYQVLHGDGNNPTGWFINGTSGPTAQMVTWGATSRAAEPYGTGDNQYLIAEQGALTKQAEPKLGAPNYKQFLLDAAPQADNTTWTPAR
jgi:prepilin-type N-terminal cleavage/methylation domain-containing protein